jgi:malonyl-CoA O-methyltransferase
MNRVQRPGVQTGYDMWAPSYDVTENPAVHLDRRFTLQALAAQAGERILDAGCGTGAHASALHQKAVRVVGVDFSQGMLAVAKQVSPLTPLVAGDLHRPLPFTDATFDAVVCSLVSEHLRQLQVFFLEARRVLVPGGRLVFTAFHPDLVEAGVEANFTTGDIEYRLGAEPHTVDDFMRDMRAAGFGSLRRQDIVGDDVMVQAVPQSQKYRGRSCLVVLHGTAGAA